MRKVKGHGTKIEGFSRAQYDAMDLWRRQIPKLKQKSLKHKHMKTSKINLENHRALVKLDVLNTDGTGK